MGEKVIILFDLDGTIIDSNEAIVSTFHHAFAVHGFAQPQDEAIEDLIGYPLDSMFTQLGVDEAQVWDFVESYKQKYRTIFKEKTSLLLGAKEAVIEASKFASLGIVTTKTGEYSQILMEHLGLMHYFDVLIGREHVHAHKPSAEPILKALEYFHRQDEEVWMIGDTKLDLLSAKNANINSIAVLSGYDDETTLKEYTDYIFEDVFKAVSFLSGKITHLA